MLSTLWALPPSYDLRLALTLCVTLPGGPWRGALLLGGPVVLGMFLVRALGGRSQNQALRMPTGLLLAAAIPAASQLVPRLHAFEDWSTLLSVVLWSLAATRVAWLLLIDVLLREGSVLGLSRIARDLLQSALYLVVSVAAARYAGATSLTLATTGGLVTAGLTFSLQQTLSDLVAGLLLQAQTPFRVGDWISYDDYDQHMGRVVEINWRATRLINSAHVEVVVPNSVLGRASIRNYARPSAASRRAIRFDVGFEHAPNSVLGLAVRSLEGLPGILRHPPPDALLVLFAPHGVTYELRYFIDDFAVREPLDSSVRARLWYALSRAGVDLVFPRTNLHVMELPAPKPEADAQLTARASALGKIDFLAVLAPEELRRLAAEVRTRLYARGEVVVREGQEDTGEFFVVSKGSLVVTVEGREVGRLRPGDFFGEMALLTGEPRTATVTASDDCELHVVDRAAFEQRIRAHAGLLETVSRVVAERQALLQFADDTGSEQEREERKSTIFTRVLRFFGST